MPKRGEAPPELSFEEIAEQYFGQWIVMKITERGEHGRILRGQVMGHGRSQRAVRKAWERAWQQDPKALLSVFVAGERYVAGDEARRLMAEAAKGEYVSAHW